MRMCLKCSKKVSDDSKICRDCGAILEDIPDDSVTGTSSESKPASQLGSPWTAAPWKSRQEECHEQSVGEQTAEPDKQVQPDTEASAWKCPQCGESVPGTFDVCWKCSTTESEPVLVQEDPDASEPDEELELIELDAEPLRLQTNEGKRPRSACLRCGSAKMMLGVSIRNQGEVGTSLQVVICGDPSALIFKDRLYGELKANICGDCGHVELRVASPKKLYRHYRKSSE